LTLSDKNYHLRKKILLLFINKIISQKNQQNQEAHKKDFKEKVIKTHRLLQLMLATSCNNKKN